jgi:hypothetical protein
VINPLVVRGRGLGQVEFGRKINKVYQKLIKLKTSLEKFVFRES